MFTFQLTRNANIYIFSKGKGIFLIFVSRRLLFLNVLEG